MLSRDRKDCRDSNAGKGFAVVASEVKAPAAQTDEATDDVASTVEEQGAATLEIARNVDQATRADTPRGELAVKP